MYFSYSPSPATSYSTSPMEIPSSSSSQTHSMSCAFPSWPQRASLSSSGSDYNDAYRSSSFIISDEELFPCDFEEEECTLPTSPYSTRSPASPHMMCEPQVVVDHSLMREVVAQEKARRERERRRRSNASSSKASTSAGMKKARNNSTSSKQMAPITEVGE